MELSLIFYLIFRLVLTTLMVFFAISILAKVFKVSWLLIISGVLILYLDVVCDTLYRSNLLEPSKVMVFNMPIEIFILSNLPYLFFLIAFAIVLNAKSHD